MISEALGQQWQEQNSGVTTHLFDVLFADSSNGWAVGDSGTIISTRDGGATWQSQLSGTNVHFQKVSFVDSLYGWVVGNQGTVLKTTNGGTSWTQLDAELWNYQDVHFVNRSVGYLVAGAQLDKPYGTISKTTNGGMTWDTTIGINAGIFQGVYFVSAAEGWVVGGKTAIDNFDPDIILHTTDSAKTWVEQSTPTFGPLFRVKFLNDRIGCAAGFSNNGQSILLTTDGGNVWAEVLAPGGPQGVLSISLVDSLTIWVARRESVYRTTNGGITWENRGPSSALTLGIYFLNHMQGWLVGTNGTVWKYHDISSSVNRREVRDPQFVLEQNYPNPFNPVTRLRFGLPQDGRVVLRIYDVMGRQVALLLDDNRSAGHHEIMFDANRLASGIYFSTLEYGGRTTVRKMLLVK